MNITNKIFERFKCSVKNPDNFGWYNTSKGDLYYFKDLDTWSCRDDRVSEEYPICWYKEHLFVSKSKVNNLLKHADDLYRLLEILAPMRIASLAKENGFNEPCIAEWVKGGIFKINEQNHSDSGYEEDYFTTYTNTFSNFYLPNFTASAPTYDQILAWFRENHKIHISVNWSKREGEYFYTILQLNEPTLTGPLTTYRNALNEGIIHAFKILKNRP